MKYRILILLFVSALNLFAQVEDDSLITEIDSLLNIEIDGTEYINSASKYDQLPEDAPSSTSIVSNEEINAFGYKSLAEVLAAQRGFYFYTDRTDEYIGVRGFGRSFDHNNRFLLLLNGNRMNSPQIGYAPLGYSFGIGLNSIERIEIVRGPGSTLYGDNAIHGVINVITKQNNSDYTPQLSFEYGSYNSLMFNLHSSGKLNRELSYSVNTIYSQTDGEDIYFKEFDLPELNNGIAENQDGSVFKSIHAIINYKDLSFSCFIKDGKNEIPTAPFNTAFNEKQEQYSNSEQINLSWSPKISFDKRIITSITYDHENYGSNLPFQLIDYDMEFFGKSSVITGIAQFIWDYTPTSRLLTGVEYRDNFSSHYNYSAGNSIVVDDKWSVKTLSVFAQNEYQFNADISLFLGLRADNYVDQELSFSPRVGIVYTPNNKHTLKLLYGRSYRAPNLLERNLEEERIVRFKSNRNLKSEYVNTSELYWNYKVNSAINLSASVYYYRLVGLIEQVFDPVDGLTKYVNRSTINAKGTELELNYQLRRGKLFLRYSYQLAEEENGTKITNSPEHIIKTGIYNKIIGPINFALSVNYEGKRKILGGGLTESFFVTNMNIFSDKLFDKFSLSLSIKNLFNKTISYPVGFEYRQRKIRDKYRTIYFAMEYGL